MAVYEDTRPMLPRFRADRAAGVKTWLRGVFEGGGAKGIAFRGALDAVLQHDCWFEAAAGSSAGAITAALIAAGYSPAELDEPMKRLLELFKLPAVLKGCSALRANGEIFSRDAFRKALDECLQRKLALFGVNSHEDGLTFKELHDATGVHLYVVAADISRREPIVFHHRYTPDCQVADAVVASASIPFAFDGGMLTSTASILRRNDSKGTQAEYRVFRTIVDGGVWVNFPMFVFTDPVFHTYMTQALELDRDTDAHAPGPIVGFLLHELVDDEGGGRDEEARLRATRAAYAGARFEHKARRGSLLAPIEQTNMNLHSDDGLAFPPNLKIERRTGPNAPRWPDPKDSKWRSLLVLIDKSLAWGTSLWNVSLVLLGLALIELCLLGGLVWFIAWWVREGWGAGLWDRFGGGSAVVAFVALFVAQLSFICSVLVLPVLANLALNIPARRVLYGLGRTLIATPGSSPWEHRHPDVIALPIPTGLTTLTVPNDVQHVIELARFKTNERLPDILKAFADRTPTAGRGR